MIYKMNLCNNPFQAIKNKTKTIEMRLDDEKRKNIKVGDTIEFTNNDTKETITCSVVNTYRYPSFDELYKNHEKKTIGYKEHEIARPEDMELYYSKEEISTYGALAIEIRLL